MKKKTHEEYVEELAIKNPVIEVIGEYIKALLPIEVKCSICGKQYEGFGNNAQPINDGRCCDECNKNVVIPRRLTDIINKNKEK